jgi:hypothetical protein
MPKDQFKEKKKEFPLDESQKNIKLIHSLATRLPWIVVFFVVLTVVVTFIEIYFSS